MARDILVLIHRDAIIKADKSALAFNRAWHDESVPYEKADRAYKQWEADKSRSERIAAEITRREWRKKSPIQKLEATLGFEN